MHTQPSHGNINGLNLIVGSPLHIACHVPQVLVYFAVAKTGDKPIDGKTDVNPEGLTAGGYGD